MNYPDLARAGARILVVFTLLVAVAGRAADSSSGSLVGSVSSTGTHNMLQGAMVSIPALNRQEITDNAGAFVLPRLPAGEVQLIISYPGFNEARRPVTVRSGAPVRLDVALQPIPAITM